MYLFSIFSIFLACGDPKEEQDDTATLPPINDTDTGPEEDRCLPHDDDTYLMKGTIEYQDGTTAKGNTLLQMCSSVGCFSGNFGEDGGFCFKNLSSGHYSFVVFPQAGDANTYASPISFVSIENGDTELDLTSPIVVPTFTVNETASTGTFDAGDGLVINVDTSTFEEETLHAASIDPATSGLPLSDFDDSCSDDQYNDQASCENAGETWAVKTIAGLWYLGPSAIGGNTSTGDSAWSFVIDTATTQNSSLSGLTEGDTVSVYNASYSDHQWLDAGTATMNSSGELVSDSSLGITVLSALIIVVEP
jgi:hypothetical protein